MANEVGYIEVAPSDLQIGDQYLFMGNTYWTVCSDWSRSINKQLFAEENTVIVVPVEFADGSRGSRVFRPATLIKIYRP